MELYIGNLNLNLKIATIQNSSADMVLGKLWDNPSNSLLFLEFVWCSVWWCTCLCIYIVYQSEEWVYCMNV